MLIWVCGFFLASCVREFREHKRKELHARHGVNVTPFSSFFFTIVVFIRLLFWPPRGWANWSTNHCVRCRRSADDSSRDYAYAVPHERVTQMMTAVWYAFQIGGNSTRSSAKGRSWSLFLLDYLINDAKPHTSMILRQHTNASYNDDPDLHQVQEQSSCSSLKRTNMV